MRGISVLIFSAALALEATVAGAQIKVSAEKPSTPVTTTAKATAQAPKAALPDSFAGWVSASPPKTVTDAAQADNTNAAALKEYDFQVATLATYSRDRETLTVRALNFSDLSGAYGAYSFYRGTGWPKEDIGTGAASNHNRVLFWRGNTVVDATFSHISPMSGSELRELANQLPLPVGSKALAPPILANLPQNSLDGQTTHYALGPASYAGAGGVLPAELVGFDRDAEAVTAGYTLRSGPATLTLIEYPTPQMAAAQEGRIRDYIKAGNQAKPAFPKPLADSDRASLEVRRSGR